MPVRSVPAWVVAAVTETTAVRITAAMLFIRGHGASDRPRPQHGGRSSSEREGRTRRYGPLAPPRRLEAADAVRRTEARRAGVAGMGGGEVATHRVRREVRPLRNVVEARHEVHAPSTSS